MKPKSRKYRDRARGMLVGLAVGDALGAPVEFIPSPSDVYIAEMGDKIERYHENYRVPKGVWTDDTSMALCLADSLLEKGGYHSYDIMLKYYNWVYYKYRAHPRGPIDVGVQTMNAIDEFDRQPVIKKGTPKIESAGNGAIMRLAPIIIANTLVGEEFSPEAMKSALEMATLSCRETHDSIAAETVTQLFATELYYAMHGYEKSEIFENGGRWLTKEEYKSFYKEKRLWLDQRALDNGEILKNLGGYIVDAFSIANWGFLSSDNFRDGMLKVIRLGGDTDTNAAIYGQLAGAYYGYKAIPKEWRSDELYLHDELVDIADQLLDLPKCPIIVTRFEDNKYFGEV